MTRIRNQVVALAALTLLASCSTGASPGANPSSTSSSSSSTSPTTATPTGPDYAVIGATQLAGPGRWAQTARGDAKAPLAVFNVTAGYQARESFIWLHDELDLIEHQAIILYQAPMRVFSDACDNKAPSPRLGATVADLAQALVAQKRTTTTKPTPVTLGGYSGLYLEMSSPAEEQLKTICGPGRGLAIWQAEEGEEGHGFEFPMTDRYWILDVEGHRVAVIARTPIGAGPISVKRVTDVAEGVTFVNPAP